MSLIYRIWNKALFHLQISTLMIKHIRMSQIIQWINPISSIYVIRKSSPRQTIKNFILD